MNNKKLVELKKMSIIIEKASSYIIELIRNNEKKSRVCMAYGDLRVYAETFYDICDLLGRQKLADTIYCTNSAIDKATQAVMKYMNK